MYNEIREWMINYLREEVREIVDKIKEEKLYEITEEEVRDWMKGNSDYVVRIVAEEIADDEFDLDEILGEILDNITYDDIAVPF